MERRRRGSIGLQETKIPFEDYFGSGVLKGDMLRYVHLLLRIKGDASEQTHVSFY
jgi:hypothetical protein